MESNISKNDRIRGGILGLAIGDALGVPYEFHKADQIPDWTQICYQPPEGYQRSYESILPGTWSDDTAQAMCLLESLLQCGKFDLIDFSDRLLAWYENGCWAVDNRTFDCGIQTSMALSAYGSGMEAKRCGLQRPDGKGNGALMRVLPLALWHRGTAAELIRDAHEQCLITHGHVCNQVCCALYCLWAVNLLAGDPAEPAYQKALQELTAYYQKEEKGAYLYELEQLQHDGNFSGGGYVVDSIRSARWLLNEYHDYESVIKGAISLGNDTDTTAAIAGGLAGVQYGIGTIPEIYLAGLRDINRIELLIRTLLGEKG